jgi:transposase
MGWRQGQSCSQDLRARFLAAVDNGMAVRAAARLFRVRVSSIYKALIRRRRTRKTAAGARRDHRPCKLSPAQEAALAAHIETHADLTLAALNAGFAFRSTLTDGRGVDYRLEQISSSGLGRQALP